MDSVPIKRDEIQDNSYLNPKSEQLPDFCRNLLIEVFHARLSLYPIILLYPFLFFTFFLPRQPICLSCRHRVYVGTEDIPKNSYALKYNVIGIFVYIEKYEAIQLSLLFIIWKKKNIHVDNTRAKILCLWMHSICRSLCYGSDKIALFAH